MGGRFVLGGCRAAQGFEGFLFISQRRAPGKGIFAEIGGDGVKIILRFAEMAIVRKIGEEAYEGFLCQILCLLAAFAVEGAVAQDVWVIFAHEAVKSIAFALLHAANQCEICVHGVLLSCMRWQNVLPAILAALHTITTLREKKIATAENLQVAISLKRIFQIMCNFF